MTGSPERSILYALSSVKYGVKGVPVNGYGPVADVITAGIEAKLHRWPVA